ncbi:uncharacterized protein TNCT_266691 [Trichonephila clavata]|uniref:Uncharacterized protein n=1 Tax=Trichonephila clavata TaxID=2740835 RepID=A0A8X6HRY6_TRICU|nr:uncharacterized protein TNCT_266691 [Trichonephila clavata]
MYVSEIDVLDLVIIQRRSMKIISVFLVAIAFAFATGDNLDDAVKYIDEVLSVYVPWAVEKANLELCELPNFTHNQQNRSADGAVTNTQVIYHSGNLTGLQTVNRKSCEQPSWASGNISVVCNIVLPEIDVKYEGRYQAITGYTSPYGVHIRQFDFHVKLTVVDIEAKLEVTSSPHVKIPSIKNLEIVTAGKPEISFVTQTDVNISFEQISGHFYHKYNTLFEEFFLADYREALERAVESVTYPQSA